MFSRYTWDLSKFRTHVHRYEPVFYHHCRNYWTSVSNQRTFMDNLAKKLNIKDHEGWFKVSNAVVAENGGNSLLVKFKGSFSKILQHVYPQYPMVQCINNKGQKIGLLANLLSLLLIHCTIGCTTVTTTVCEHSFHVITQIPCLVVADFAVHQHKITTIGLLMLMHCKVDLFMMYFLVFMIDQIPMGSYQTTIKSVHCLSMFQSPIVVVEHLPPI